MYGTIKVHKPNHIIRPIVDTRNTIAGPLAEILSTILKTYKNGNISILNTEDLIHKLNRAKLSKVTHTDRMILASLDVRDMFTNIPTRAATQHIINKFGKSIQRKWTLLEKELINLMTFTMQELNIFKINNI